MKVTAQLFYGDEASRHEIKFEIDYVKDLYDAMNEEVEKLPQETDGIPVGNLSRATIDLVRE